MPATQRLPNDRLVPLLQGAYAARSVIAEAQRCVNLYPEPNPQDAEAPVTHYPIPGLVKRSSPPLAGRARGNYRSTVGKLFCVVGQTVYYVDMDFNWQKLGVLNVQASTPVSMVDNGQTLLIADGSQFGYQVDLVSLVFSEITDPNFFGADRIDFLSTFVVSNIPGTQEYQSTHSGAPLVWDPLYVASKAGYPDLLQTLIVMHLEIWLIGTLTTEIWYNAGGATFPFALFPGTFIEHGTIAKYSIAKHDLRVFWLSQDKDGRAIVVMGAAYKAQRISTFAIENELSTYSTLADAIADIYQIDGHIFYRLHFPTADKTWVFDVQTGEWHEIEALDDQGTVHRARDIFATAAYGKNVSLDWNNGDIYEIRTDVYDDAGHDRVYRRGFPTMVSNGSRVAYFSFIAEMELGTANANSGNLQNPTDDPSLVLPGGGGIFVNVLAAYTLATPLGETLISPEGSIANASTQLARLTFNSPAAVEDADGWFPYVAVTNSINPPTSGTETKQVPSPLPFGTNWTGDQYVAGGELPPTNNSAVIQPPEIFLRWSDDAGKTWNEPIAQSLGAQGQTEAQAKWWKLGNSRRRVFELFWSIPCKTALNGAWVDSMPMAS